MSLSWEEYKQRCFRLGLDAQKLRESKAFIDEAETLLNEAKKMGRWEEGTAYMAQMIERKGEFPYLYRKECPILVYRGDDKCYGVLDSFADSFIKCLRDRRIAVEVYDISEKDIEGLLELKGKSYRAIVGFQTFIYSVCFQNGQNVHDSINAPKFHFIFDHPVMMKEHMDKGPEEYYILTHGRDYQEFVEKYFKAQMRKSYLLPPAGIAPQVSTNSDEKTIDISFIGTWHDYRSWLEVIRKTKSRERFIANRFLHIMKKSPNLRAEWALQQALADYGITLDDENFRDVMFEFRQICFIIMTYYREKIIQLLLEEGFIIHVYGESWKKSPLVRYKNLICHAEVSVSESMEVWQRSKLSLNIMSWHKGGFTERIANMLLCETVVISDKSYYLEENFEDGEDIVLFDLEHPEELIQRIYELLADDVLREKIAQNGRKKALQNHTWEKRTEEFLAILESIENGQLTT